ncbi:MAG: hypothetical protein LPK11_02460 [Chromatiaceae bacterium]|nr:hypothetical protein [Chromatiaceae bacterium]
MKPPELKTQLQQLCALLQPFQFGIGGSCLLWQLGLEAAPNDIDIVCTETDFTAICAVLNANFSLQPVVPHPLYRSAQFCRFSRSGWPDIELMAGIAVVQQQQQTQWTFVPQRCHWQDGVCWMPPADWLQLYQLFNRPERVAQLRRYLVQLRLNSLS